MYIRKTARSGIQGIFGALVSLLITFPFIMSAAGSHSLLWSIVSYLLGYAAIGFLMWWVWRTMKQMDKENDTKEEDKSDERTQKLIRELSNNIYRANDKRDTELIEAMQEQTKAIVAALQKQREDGKD